jgi:hypothetical protein
MAVPGKTMFRMKIWPELITQRKQTNTKMDKQCSYNDRRKGTQTSYSINQKDVVIE